MKKWKKSSTATNFDVWKSRKQKIPKFFTSTSMTNLQKTTLGSRKIFRSPFENSSLKISRNHAAACEILGMFWNLKVAFFQHNMARRLLFWFYFFLKKKKKLGHEEIVQTPIQPKGMNSVQQVQEVVTNEHLVRCTLLHNLCHHHIITKILESWK